MAGYVALAHGFPENRKVMGLHDRAFRFHVTALDYCGRNLTDGHVSARGVKVVAAIMDTTIKRWPRELVAAGLWSPDKDGDGFWIKDYLIYNPSAAAMKDLSDKRRAAGVRGAEAKWRKERIGRDMRMDVATALGVQPGQCKLASCGYCETPITVDWTDPGRVRFLDSDGRPTPEIDHVEPLANGGPHSSENLVLACLTCNRQKGSKPLASASGTSQSKRQNKPDLPAEQSRSEGLLEDSSGRHFEDESLPEMINPENEFAVAKLMRAIGSHADTGTRLVVAKLAVGLPPAALAKVTESVEQNHPRNRAAYAVRALQAEAKERNAA